MEIASAAFAILAAILWLVSAKVSLPNKFTIYTITPLGGAGSGHSKELEQLGKSLKRQSNLSAAAALSAAVSALCQAAHLAFK